MPRSGDFLTLDLLGETLQIRNFDGECHAHLNVSSHRHCLLTSKKIGRSPMSDCQYHGWQYEASGRTRKIPEANCFRPFDPENARLVKFPLETAGELLFVSLAENPPSLREFLGSLFDTLEARFRRPFRQNWAWEHPFEFNWKLALENTVESHHIPVAHPSRFGGARPGEANRKHELDESFSSLTHDHREDRWATFWSRRGAWSVGGKITDVYAHHVVHPNLVFVFVDNMFYAQEYVPTSRNRSRTTLRMFTPRATSWSPSARFASWLTAGALRNMVRKIMLEDSRVCSQQQLGLEASRHRGCIGARRADPHLPPVSTRPLRPARAGVKRRPGDAFGAQLSERPAPGGINILGRVAPRVFRPTLETLPGDVYSLTSPNPRRAPFFATWRGKPHPRMTPDPLPNSPLELPPELEADLLPRLRAGDPAAFEVVVRTLGPRLMATALRLTAHEQDAQDALQEAFLSAYRGLAGFQGDSRLATWLHRVVVNAALMRIRARRRQPDQSIDDLLPKFSESGALTGVEQWAAAPDASATDEETRELVRRGIDRLPEPYRTVLLLRDIEDLDTRETARQLQVSEAVVKTRLHRARQALRTILDEHFRGDRP